MASFRHLSLLEAERELVGACLDQEAALRIALGKLPLHPFRSHEAHDLDRVLYALSGMYLRGAFTTENRETLSNLWDDTREGYGYLDTLWCPWGVSAEYVTGLCDAINESNQLQDDAVASTRRWHFANPLRLNGNEEPATPLPATSPHPPWKGRRRPPRGGVG